MGRCDSGQVIKRIKLGTSTLKIAALVDVVRGLRTVNNEFALISQRRTGNLGFRTFHAEQRSAG